MLKNQNVFVFGVLAAAFIFLIPINDASTMLDNPKYGQKTSVGPDAETGGWFIHLGLTGLRVKLPQDRPTEFEVAHVLKGSPATGLVNVGDRILGVGKQKFKTPHVFGYGVGKFGYDGPMKDFAAGLDAAMGGKGVLPVLIERDGKIRIVKLEVGKKYGKYSKTWPKNCDRSTLILEEAISDILKKQKRSGLWSDRPHLNAFALLALLGHDLEAHKDLILKSARSMARSTEDVIRYDGLDCWKYTLYGIALAEVYLATGEKWILPELEEIERWLVKAQISDGGFGHRPANKPGGNGYGSICILTGQAKMAWALMLQCGLDINEEAFSKAHEFLKKGTGKNGYVWYEDGVGGAGYADMGRTGAAVLAHALAPGRPGYQEYALRSAKCIGKHPDTFSDTHGSPILGMAWTALGAALDPSSMRKLFDENKWWFTLSQCAEGNFYYQPNRDNNPQDYTAAPRLSATVAAALILTLPSKSLALTRISELKKK